MLQKILDNLQIKELNPMQQATIEAAKKNSDILLLSPTGSGKTLAFLLPVLAAIDKRKQGVQVLVLVPSRELALQIEQVFKQMSTGYKVNCCYGGHSTRIEKNNLAHPPALLVGTPGRIGYHIRHQNVDTSGIHTLVLDEFDKSLESGFKEEMSYIINELSGLRKTILTSATNMPMLPDFTNIRRPHVLNFLHTNAPISTALKLKFIKSENTDKLQMLFVLICTLENKPTLVFCNHREAVERVSELLLEKGMAHGIFHGGMEQEDRERSLIKFRNGSHRLLITTDLASRGLDIPEIEAVVHYQLPITQEVFTHRNGRTARMNAEGTAYILLSAVEYMPPFIGDGVEEHTLPKKAKLPEAAPWRTLYIGAGKKDKINKMDIVGMLLQKGNLAKDELGLVEVLDNTSYAAIKSNKVETLLKSIREEKIKNRKIKIQISK